MAKPKGTAKTGGRKKGTPNKRTLLLTESLEQNNLDIVMRLKALLPKVSPDKQADILLNLMSYVYPKRKAVEYSETNPIEDNKIVIEFVKPDGQKEVLP